MFLVSLVSLVSWWWLLNMNDIERFAQVGTAAAMAAGKLLMERLRTGFTISHKGATNLVTEVDIAAERLIVSRILESFPDHTILAEENHASAKRGEHTWIIDPIDGTTNYAHGYPVFAVSIGLEIEGELEWGIVYNPNLGEVFTARRGGGAFCNGTPLRVSRIADLGLSLLATGFPYDIRTSKANLGHFVDFMLRSQAVRRGGSAAMDFCYVAAGRFEGFWEVELHPWDSAAGFLIVRESGGVVTDFSGAHGSIYCPEVVASNGLIHQEMLNVLREGSSLTSL
jgi:myo-inositol-1(or 4)-monophosphatase